MNLVKDIEVEEIFNNYPKSIRQKLMHMRQLIVDVASETEGLNKLEETLRWGEPSYLTKGGSTIRIAWKKSTPDQFAICFICTTSLVDTFKLVYGDKFKFENNRAIVFSVTDEIPVQN